MITEGLGELGKSGIAELTFKDRHKRFRQFRVTEALVCKAANSLLVNVLTQDDCLIYYT
jgi:hypothetical protein